jgi:hypothetical protein
MLLSPLGGISDKEKDLTYLGGNVDFSCVDLYLLIIAKEPGICLHGLWGGILSGLNAALLGTRACSLCGSHKDISRIRTLLTALADLCSLYLGRGSSH